MSKEKKKTIIFTVILAVLALALIVVFIVSNLKSSGTIIDAETKEIMENFDKYYNSKEKTIIYYASSSCSWCEIQTPVLETIAKDYDMDYYYVDSSKLPAKQRKQVLKKLGIEHSTPNTFIVENGKVIDVAYGYTEGKKYVEFFKENEMLPEDAVYSAEQYITSIDFDGYKNLISDGGLHAIVIGQTTCSHCINFKPAINSVAKDNNITINYLNLTEMSQDQYTEFTSSLKQIGYNEEDFVNNGSFGTPLTLIVENGKVKGYISGERTISQLVREFKKYGLI